MMSFCGPPHKGCTLVAKHARGAVDTWLLPNSASTLLVAPAHCEAAVLFIPRLTTPNGIPVSVLNADIMRSANSCALGPRT